MLGIYLVLNENLPFYMGVFALQARTGEIFQCYFTGECWGIMSYSNIVLQNRNSFSLQSFCGDE